MNALPSGTVTFMLTDVERSCSLWERDARAMDSTLIGFDERFGACVGGLGGSVVAQRGEGDSHFAAFAQASAGIGAAVEVQRSLATDDDFRVRMALHTAEAVPRDGNYYGTHVNRAARLRSAAHGGQIVVSRITADLARDDLTDDVTLRSLGIHRIRDWPRSDEVFQVEAPSLRSDFPPLAIAGAERVRIMTVVALDIVEGIGLLRHHDEDGLAAGQRALGRALRETFEQARGSTLRLFGDGCLATFDDPLRALDFTRRSHAWARTVDETFRSAIHAGRIEVLDEDIAGEALFAVSWVVRHARPDETLVTRTVADVCATVVADASEREIDVRGRTWTVHALDQRGREP